MLFRSFCQGLAVCVQLLDFAVGIGQQHRIGPGQSILETIVVLILLSHIFLSCSSDKPRAINRATHTTAVTVIAIPAVSYTHLFKQS